MRKTEKINAERSFRGGKGSSQTSGDIEQKYQALFEQSPYGILLIDTEGKILDFNETAHRDLGYTREEFAHLTIADIDPVESAVDVRARLSRILEEGSAEFEVRHRTKRGEIRDVHVIIKALTLSGQTLFHAIWRDITNRRRAENAVELFRNLLNRSSEAIFVNDPKTGRFLDMNNRACASLGYNREELLEKGVMDIEANIPDNFSWLAHVTELREKGALLFEGMHRRKDGTTFPIEANVSYVSLDSGQYMIAAVRDITERKRTEAMLRETNTRLETLIQAMPDMVSLKDGAGRHIMVNRAVEECTGCKQEEVVGKTNNELLPKDLAEMCNISDADAIRQGRSIRVEERSIDKEGRVQYLDSIKAPIYDGDGNLTGLVCVARDVTERKKAGEALQRSEDKFRTLFESATDAIFILDVEGNFIDLNKTAYGRLGYAKEEMLTKHISELAHPDFREKIHERFEHLQKHGWCICESAHLRKDGTVMPVEVNAKVIDFDGKKVVFSIIRDTTERKQSEEKVRQSERFIRSILDAVDEGFIVVDRDFRILTANKAYGCQVSLPCDEVIGRHCYEISHKMIRPCYEGGEDCAVRHVFEKGEPHTALHKHPDAKGSILYYEMKAFPIKDGKGAVISVIETINNITEKHLLKEEQLKSQKLEAIGILAGGIAHDFNNLLQGIFGYISMAKRTLSDKDKPLAMLDQAEQALQMSVHLTTQLLTFSKGGKPAKKLISVRPVIENSVKFALSGSRIDYRIHVDKWIRMVEADEGQIGQVMQNIVLNAEQAMPMGGIITIEARNVSAHEKGIPPVLKQRNYVEISIKDSGIGIPEQYLAKIFDPYFTTKDKGSGLGLATSYSIIKNHGGLIDVKSNLGEGTTFFVYLPSVEAVENSAATVLENVQALREGKILLMDDEDVVRNIAGVMIRSLGHEVELVENGEEAIEKYRQSIRSGRRFDIVIMDLTIRGGMGGEEAIKALLEIDPDVKAIVSSGYTDSSAISEYEASGFKACLTKPYNIDSLNAALNSLLD
jgi:PAS domain S-box-containing protein